MSLLSIVNPARPLLTGPAYSAHAALRRLHHPTCPHCTPPHTVSPFNIISSSFLLSALSNREASGLCSESAVTVASSKQSFLEAVTQYIYPQSTPADSSLQPFAATAERLYSQLQLLARGSLDTFDSKTGLVSSSTTALARLLKLSPTTEEPVNSEPGTLLNQYLASLSSFDAPTLVPTLLLVFLASFLLSRPSAMGSWRGWGSNWAGRFSPFTRSPASGGEVEDSAFSYITNEDLKRNEVERGHEDDREHEHGGHHHSRHSHSHSHSHSEAGRSREDLGAGSSDVLILKNKRQAFSVQFPARSIDRGEVRVGDIRAAAAKKLGGSASAIKIFYKGSNLKDDRRSARDEGLSSGRQSELLCVVGDGPIPRDEDDEDDEDEDDYEVDGRDAIGDASGKSKKKRKNRKKKPRRSDQDSGTATPSSTAAAPSASATFIPPSHIPTPVSRSAAQTPTPSTQTPQTPVDKIRVLVGKFETEFLPLCEAYVTSPPSDKAKRDFEHKKLTETIMGQILLKLDGVETEGDQEARVKRKEAVKEVNGWLSRLDKVVSA